MNNLFHLLYLIRRKNGERITELRHLITLLCLCGLGNMDIAGIETLLRVFGMSYKNRNSLNSSLVDALNKKKYIAAQVKQGGVSEREKCYRITEKGKRWLIDQLPIIQDAVSELPSFDQDEITETWIENLFEKRRDSKYEHAVRVNELCAAVGGNFCHFANVTTLVEEGNPDFRPQGLAGGYNKNGFRKKGMASSDVLCTLRMPNYEERAFLAMEVDLGNMGDADLIKKLDNYIMEYGYCIQELTIIFLLRQVRNEKKNNKNMWRSYTKTDLNQIYNFLRFVEIKIREEGREKMLTVDMVKEYLSISDWQNNSLVTKTNYFLDELRQAAPSLSESQRETFTDTCKKMMMRKQSMIEVNIRQEENNRRWKLSEAILEWVRSKTAEGKEYPHIMAISYGDLRDIRFFQLLAKTCFLVRSYFAADLLSDLNILPEETRQNIWYFDEWRYRSDENTFLFRNVLYLEETNLLVSIENYVDDITAKLPVQVFLKNLYKFPGIVMIVLVDGRCSREWSYEWQKDIEDWLRCQGTVPWDFKKCGHIVFVDRDSFFAVAYDRQNRIETVGCSYESVGYGRIDNPNLAADARQRLDGMSEEFRESRQVNLFAGINRKT